MAIRRFTDFEKFMAHFTARACELAMEVKEVPLADLAPHWVIGDAVARPDGRFFRVAGLSITRAAGREVSGWRQPIIAGETDGRLVIVTAAEPRRYALVRVKAEPGNVGLVVNGIDTRVLVAPTLQFSQGNLDHNAKAKRGELDERGRPMKPVPLCDLLELVNVWSPGSSDGGRFLGKVNQYGFIEAPRGSDAFERIEDEVAALGDGTNDFAWVSYAVVWHLIDNGLANEFLERLYARL